MSDNNDNTDARWEVDLDGPLELDALWAVLDGRESPEFAYIAWHTKTMKIALGIGPVDITVRPNKFSMRWKGTGASQYPPKLALPTIAHLMRRAHIGSVNSAVVALMPSSPVAGHPSFEPPDFLVWFVRQVDGVEIFTRAPLDNSTRPARPTPIPNDGSLALPIPWSSPHWRKYHEVAGGLCCPHCRETSVLFRRLDDALVCPKCGCTFSANT